MSVDHAPLRLICDACGQRTWSEPGQEYRCVECGGQLRRFGPLEGLWERLFAPPDMVDSRLYHRHLQLVELAWTADGRGREFFEILKPKGVSYSRFTRDVTQLVCRGLREGWVSLRLPPAPVPDDAAYGLEIHDMDRFVDGMAGLYTPGERRASAEPGK